VGIVNQQLLFMPRLRHSVPLLSVLRNTRAIATLIRDNKLSQLDSTIETCKDKGMFTFASYRDDYLSSRKDFRQPLGLNAASPVNAPQEYWSRIFDYDSQAGVRLDDVQAGALASERPGLPCADIDDYISELERRSA